MRHIETFIYFSLKIYLNLIYNDVYSDSKSQVKVNDDTQSILKIHRITF